MPPGHKFLAKFDGALAHCKLELQVPSQISHGNLNFPVTSHHYCSAIVPAVTGDRHGDHDGARRHCTDSNRQRTRNSESVTRLPRPAELPVTSQPEAPSTRAECPRPSGCLSASGLAVAVTSQGLRMIMIMTESQLSGIMRVVRKLLSLVEATLTVSCS